MAVHFTEVSVSLPLLPPLHVLVARYLAVVTLADATTCLVERVCGGPRVWGRQGAV